MFRIPRSLHPTLLRSSPQLPTSWPRFGLKVEPPAKEKPKPAVSVRRSIRPDQLVCLICGRKQKVLKRHLAVEHELTPNQYRDSFGLKPEYPMAAPNYAQQRREFAVKIGLGRSKPAPPTGLDRTAKSACNGQS